MMRIFILTAGLLAMCACSAEAQNAPAASGGESKRERAYFAMGCFWCGEADFEKIDGVYEAVSGYAGGTTENPTYQQVTAGGTGHYEAVRVSYDPNIVSYRDLLDIFWRNVDPLDPSGQFCDKGPSYRSAIFPRNGGERRAAEASRDSVQEKLGEEVATRIVAANVFYAAERYHQDYYIKNKLRYAFYREGCGRDARLAEIAERLGG
ncbi:peptide-methionine (S)-S-oxide reductase MsrA [Pacificimonas sp. WHA3]|uniref:Peptide methionine sulfoxide reductase MsrA n=1 Tax=Pacificimonas pallii TaxID=2827236 RepID=A0ABS6SIE8_9SPHN|nr:peptide-methionine (S)-S-oxide reductase MsrA [Pacificimonas pallii]MBV7257701.1 peptide-methionine (S)-S-oxide reductase MsrA [Pacificimonas pallii]